MPWRLRTNDEDRAESFRQHTERGDAHFSSPAYLESLDAMSKAQTERLQAQTMAVETFESAVGWEPHTPQVIRRKGDQKRYKDPEDWTR